MSESDGPELFSEFPLSPLTLAILAAYKAATAGKEEPFNPNDTLMLSQFSGVPPLLKIAIRAFETKQRRTYNDVPEDLHKALSAMGIHYESPLPPVVLAAIATFNQLQRANNKMVPAITAAIAAYTTKDSIPVPAKAIPWPFLPSLHLSYTDIPLSDEEKNHRRRRRRA